ncbi:hypothetical protein E3N88_46088 [Mikania micrantha]|uniref:Small ribosomal subunit protein uS13m n=1 Tax=Mikania micrantha TaxID=192012 RepID=A0A5N6L784_9ASTR|nr:hypothetical protein E3N88_46088 [Mikania micrantha]
MGVSLWTGPGRIRLERKKETAGVGDCPVLLTDPKEGGSATKQAGREGTKCLNKTRTNYMLNTNFLVLPLAHGDRPYAPGAKRRGHFSLLYRSGSSSKEQQWLVAFPIDLSRGWDEGSRMFYISGARSVADEQVRIASTKIDGIGPKKAILVRYRLGISGNIKIKELTKYQIDQIEQMIGQDHVVHWELKRGERADIERLISISCYRGIRHQDGSPLRGQRTHTNARTCRKQIRK